VPALLTSHQSRILPVKAKLENNPTGMAKENAPSLPIISRIPNLNMVTLFIVDNKNTPLISKLVLVCICTDHLPMHTGVRTLRMVPDNSRWILLPWQSQVQERKRHGQSYAESLWSEDGESIRRRRRGYSVCVCHHYRWKEHGLP
jgi:hypothetical protein